LQTDIVNDPVQAALIASRELKQSRVDKVIEFRTDFSYLGLKAGDLISVTNTPYNFSNKVFRIISLQEDDSDEGVLSLSIRALEYDANVYSTAGLERDDRFTDTGIITKDKNTATTTSDGSASSNNLTNVLLGAGGASLLLSLLNAFAKSGSATTGTRAYTGVGMQPVVYAFNTGILSATRFDTIADTINLGYSTVLPYSGIYKCKYNINWGGSGDYPDGVFKNSTMVARTNGTDVGFGAGNFTGDQYAAAYEDHFLEEVFIGTAGQPVDFFYTYATNWTSAIFLINAELSLIQRTA